MVCAWWAVGRAYMRTVTAVKYLFLKIMKISSVFLSKVLASVIYEKQQQQTPCFHFFPRVAEAFVPKLTEVTFGRVVHAQKTEIVQIYFRKCSARARKTRSRRSFRQAASQIDQNQGAM